MPTGEELAWHFFMDDMFELKELKLPGHIIIVREQPCLVGFAVEYAPEPANDEQFGIL